MTAEYEAYCMKCRDKRTFEGKVVELKNGRPAAQGSCPVCGTKMTRIMSKKDAEDASK
jgi:Zn finger protein HypA/HybF involved in hydrogenase expression